MRKYIIVPEYAPLYALRKCFGPTKGPLSRPTLVPIDLIGELLHQTGKEKVSIFEVIPEGKGFSDPVQLTLTNYTLPYEEIVGRTPDPEDTVVVAVEEHPPAAVEPVVVSTAPESPEEEESEEVQAPEAPVEPVVEEVPEAPVVETTIVTDPAESMPSEDASEDKTEEGKVETENPEKPEPEEEETGSADDMTASVKLEESATDVPQAELPATPEEIDWSQLTKAERRRLRKELAAQNQPAAESVEPQE